MNRIKIIMNEMNAVEFKNFMVDFVDSVNQADFVSYKWLSEPTDELPHEILKRAFRWSRSSKGCKYWLRVCNKIERNWFDNH